MPNLAHYVTQRLRPIAQWFYQTVPNIQLPNLDAQRYAQLVAQRVEDVTHPCYAHTVAQSIDAQLRKMPNQMRTICPTVTTTTDAQLKMPNRYCYCAQ